MKNMGKNDILKLILCIIICQAVGSSGSVFTNMSVKTWYPTMVKPWFAPPDGLIPVVWIILFTLMGISLFLVWREGFDRPGSEGGDLHICPSVRIQYRLVGCILRLEVSLLRIDSDSAALADDTADHIQVLAGLEERRPAARPIHPLGELCHGSELQHNGAQSISLAQKS